MTYKSRRAADIWVIIGISMDPHAMLFLTRIYITPALLTAAVGGVRIEKAIMTQTETIYMIEPLYH